MLVVALYALVLVELGLEEGAQGLQLGVLGVARGVGGLGEVALEALDAVLDGRVADLRLRDVLLQLRLRLPAVGAAQRALVQLPDVVDVVGQALDVVAEALHAAQEVLLRQHRGGGRLVAAVGVAVAVVLQLILVGLLLLRLRGVGVLLCRPRPGDGHRVSFPCAKRRDKTEDWRMDDCGVCGLMVCFTSYLGVAGLLRRALVVRIPLVLAVRHCD